MLHALIFLVVLLFVGGVINRIGRATNKSTGQLMAILALMMVGLGLVYVLATNMPSMGGGSQSSLVNYGYRH